MSGGGRVVMQTAKKMLIQAIEEQPDDSTAEELLRELFFNQMISRGIEDVQNGRTIAHEDVEKEIDKWAR
jgi:predicted transcriptional regulator